jgi:hypothetical protein
MSIEKYKVETIEDNSNNNVYEESFSCNSNNNDYKENIEDNSNNNVYEESFSCNSNNNDYKEDIEDNSNNNVDKELFSCNICQKTITTKSKLNNHIKQVHLGLKDHQCETCERTFTSKQVIVLHVEFVNSLINDVNLHFKCEVAKLGTAATGKFLSGKKELLCNAPKLHRISGLPKSS